MLPLFLKFFNNFLHVLCVLNGFKFSLLLIHLVGLLSCFKVLTCTMNDYIMKDKVLIYRPKAKLLDALTNNGESLPLLLIGYGYSKSGRHYLLSLFFLEPGRYYLCIRYKDIVFFMRPKHLIISSNTMTWCSHCIMQPWFILFPRGNWIFLLWIHLRFWMSTFVCRMDCTLASRCSIFFNVSFFLRFWMATLQQELIATTVKSKRGHSVIFINMWNG